MKTFKGKGFTVQYQDDEATKQALYDKVLAFFTKHEVFSGESVMQCDAPQIEAPELLADLADEVFKFETEWKDE